MESGLRRRLAVSSAIDWAFSIEGQIPAPVSTLLPLPVRRIMSPTPPDQSPILKSSDSPSRSVWPVRITRVISLRYPSQSPSAQELLDMLPQNRIHPRLPPGPRAPKRFHHVRRQPNRHRHFLRCLLLPALPIRKHPLQSLRQTAEGDSPSKVCFRPFRVVHIHSSPNCRLRSRLPHVCWPFSG
jgi:hypothetical protein